VPSASTRFGPGASIATDSLREIATVGGIAIPIHIQDRNSQKGASRLKTILGILFLAALIYLAVKIVPPFVNNYQFQDALVEEARFAGVNRKDADTIRSDVFKKMQEIGIPGSRDDIRVESVATGTRISIDYTVVVDLPGYELPLKFHPTADSNSI
jgi:hypothetical protein